jgi:hypothetical protein
MSGRSDIARFLCKNGADANLRDIKGQTPLHLLTYVAIQLESTNTGLLDLFVAHGVRVDDLEVNGNTSLHFMVGRLCYIDAVRVLCHGTSAAAQNLTGDTRCIRQPKEPLERGRGKQCRAARELGTR